MHNSEAPVETPWQPPAVTEIRAAEASDAHEIAAVHVASWQVAYRGLLPEGLLTGLSVAGRERMWSTILGEPSPRSAVFAGGCRGTVLGLASIGVSRDGDADGDVGELSCGLGFGAATLWVLDGNDRALRFYEQARWAEDGRCKVDTGPGGVELRKRRMHSPLREPRTAGWL